MHRIVFLVLLLTQLSQAGHLSSIDVKCPVCATEFVGYVYMSSTSFGADRDFLPRSSSPFYRTLVTCPECSLSHFTGHLEKMASSLDQDTKDEWRKRHPVGGTVEPDDVEKMRLLIEFEELLGSPDLTRAYINLQAAWVVRLTHNPFAERVQDIGPEKVHSYLEGLPSKPMESLSCARDLVKSLPQRTGEERAEILTIIAYLYCDAGEFDELLGQSELPHHGVAAVQEEERGFQRQTVIEMRKALKSAEDAEAANLTYLVGELNRRLGNKAEAQEWLRKASAHPSIDPDIKTWAEEQLRECDRLPDQPVTRNNQELWNDTFGIWLPTLLLVAIFTFWGARRRTR